MRTDEVKGPPLRGLIAILLALIAGFHVANALAGKSLFRATSLGTALEYKQGSINLLQPVIVGFNAQATPTALEFPLWQATTGLAFKLSNSTWYGWGNIVSLLIFATSLWPFLQLARRYAGERAGWWALAFYLAQPLVVLMAGEGSPDGLALVATIWFLFFTDKMVRTGCWGCLVLAALFASLAAVTKLPFFMAAGLCSIGMLIMNGEQNWRPWVQLAAVGLFAGAVFTAWTMHTNSLAGRAEYPYAELRLSQSQFIRYWYFGDLHYRLSPGHWLKGAWRFTHATLGSLPLMAVLAVALLRQGCRLPKIWLLASLLTALVFTHLVLEHWHYYLMCCPAVALLCGATLAQWEPFVAQQVPWPSLRLVLALLVLVSTTVDGLLAMKIGLDYDPFPMEMSAVVQAHTQPGDKLIVFNEPTWGGEVLFRSGRKGLSVLSLKGSPSEAAPKGLLDLLNNEADLARLKALGYNKLVLLSESPARFAAVAVNPGSKRKRLLYPATLSPKVDAWPVVYRSEDLLIKEIR